MSLRTRAVRIVVFMLTVAMVFAHWQGLSHRIAHAAQYPAGGKAMALEAPPGPHHKAVQHSCLAYDAATVAPALHTPTYNTGILPSGRILAQWIAFDSWVAPFSSHFSSRAPPLA